MVIAVAGKPLTVLTVHDGKAVRLSRNISMFMTVTGQPLTEIAVITVMTVRGLPLSAIAVITIVTARGQLMTVFRGITVVSSYVVAVVATQICQVCLPTVSGYLLLQVHGQSTERE